MSDPIKKVPQTFSISKDSLEWLKNQSTLNKSAFVDEAIKEKRRGNKCLICNTVVQFPVCEVCQKKAQTLNLPLFPIHWSEELVDNMENMLMTYFIRDGQKQMVVAEIYKQHSPHDQHIITSIPADFMERIDKIRQRIANEEEDK